MANLLKDEIWSTHERLNENALAINTKGIHELVRDLNAEAWSLRDRQPPFLLPDWGIHRVRSDQTRRLLDSLNRTLVGACII